MTNREYIRSLTDDLLVNYMMFHIEWDDVADSFCNKYCKKCEVTVLDIKGDDGSITKEEFRYCELTKYGYKCKFLGRRVTDGDYIKEWLDDEHLKDEPLNNDYSEFDDYDKDSLLNNDEK